MRILAFPILFAAGALTAGCDRSARSEPDFVVRDSAGVTIVENRRPQPDIRLGWEIGSVPSLSIGGAVDDPGHDLFNVTDATRLADGVIVVADAGSGELRVFDASGTHRESLGGRGEGPGEFGNAAPSTVGPWQGDSIVASDTFARRVSVFGSNGEHGRTFVLESPYYRLRGVLRDGRMFLGNGSTLASAVVGTGVARREIAYGIARPDGGLHKALGTSPGEEWYVVSDERGMAVYPQPFARTTRTAVWGNLVVITPNVRYELRAYDADGALAMIVRRDHDLRGPTGTDVDEHLARLYADASEQERASALADLRNMPRVETFPAFRHILADRLDHLWVEEYPLPGGTDAPTALWTVFDPGGRMRGQVETPAGLEIFEIGADYILGSMADELGTESVQLWSLDRSES